jgi:hypothetical protein
METKQRFALPVLIGLAALALACGITSGIGEELSDVQQSLGTARAELTEMAPTLQAQATLIVGQVTESGPEFNATLTAVVGTADALGGSVDLPEIGIDQPTIGADMVATAGAQEGGLPQYTGGDSMQTTLLELIPLNVQQQASIASGVEAHNWVFEGQGGQTVVVNVTGLNGADPRARLIDPDGAVLVEMDDIDLDAGKKDVSIVTKLPVTGLYTVRVDLIAPGDYQIIIEG